jgi:hypothetical protein
MKTYKTSELQDRLAAKLDAAGFAGQWWGRGDDAERFYFGKSAQITKDGKPIRGIKVWLQFDVPSELDGAALRVSAPKRWYETTLATWHAEAFAIAIETVDPEQAAKLRAEMAANRGQVGDLVEGESD